MYAFRPTQSKYSCLYSRERVFKFHVEFLLSLRPTSPSFFMNTVKLEKDGEDQLD